MKNVMSKKTVLAMVMALVSFGVLAQHDHAIQDNKMEMSQPMEPKFQDKALGSAYNQYIMLKEALVASLSDEAKQAAEKLQQQLVSVKNTKSAQAEVSKVVSAENLKDQRKAFASLSKQMATLVKANVPSMGIA